MNRCQRNSMQYIFAILAIGGGSLAGGGRTAHGQEPAANPLPLTRVVLFNSGVGFFEHAAEVDGDAQIGLKFNSEDINDLLKSMVLEDLGGGTISRITYGSQDPITKTLRTFAIDLTTDPTLADLLKQVRGERVEVEAASQVTGVIVGVEKRKQPAAREDQTVEAEYLNLLTDDGLRSLPLANVTKIRLLNSALDLELRQALTVLAMGHAADKKTVTLSFLGQGKRPVRVGYIQEAPIWKTSYRLVLKDEQPPFLQGWAIVENTTEEDWSGVGLTLVSGRPISFVMDLYQPLYVPRPVVEPELFASLRPQTYGQDLAEAEADFAKAKDAADGTVVARRGGATRKRAAPGAPAPAATAESTLGAHFSADLDVPFQQGVQSAAQAMEVGELFQYAIDAPVSLPRQQSAMLPIVNESVAGEKVSIFNLAVHPKHPLNGLRLKNTSGLHLMQGPITVFDGGVYAGDARIEDLQPGTERLISYALDLDTEVVVESQARPESLVSVRLVKGTLETRRKLERGAVYRIKNSGNRSKLVLVETPVEQGWKLVAPAEAQEKTRDLYRFAVTAEPGKPAELKLSEEQLVSQNFAFGNLEQGAIQYYLESKVVSPAIKEAFAEVIRKKAALQELAARQQRLEQQIQVISQDQTRNRENMAQLERNSELYNRIVKKFGDQEDQIESLRTQITKAQEEHAAASTALDAYLLGLELK